MSRGVVSVWQNNHDPMLAKILIKERENSAQLTDYGTNYIGEGMYYPVYGSEKFPILKDGCEVSRSKNSQILKGIKYYKSFFRPTK